MANVDPGASPAIWRSVAALASFVRYSVTPGRDHRPRADRDRNPPPRAASHHDPPPSKSTGTKRSHSGTPKPSSCRRLTLPGLRTRAGRPRTPAAGRRQLRPALGEGVEAGAEDDVLGDALVGLLAPRGPPRSGPGPQCWPGTSGCRRGPCRGGCRQSSSRSGKLEADARPRTHGGAASSSHAGRARAPPVRRCFPPPAASSPSCPALLSAARCLRPRSSPPIAGEARCGRTGDAAYLRPHRIRVLPSKPAPTGTGQELLARSASWRRGRRGGPGRNGHRGRRRSPARVRPARSGCASAGGSTAPRPSWSSPGAALVFVSGSKVATVMPAGICSGPSSGSSSIGASVKRAMMERCAMRVDSSAHVSASPGLRSGRAPRSSGRSIRSTRCHPSAAKRLDIDAMWISVTSRQIACCRLCGRRVGPGLRPPG